MLTYIALLQDWGREGTNTLARHLPDRCHFAVATISPLIAQIPDKKNLKTPPERNSTCAHRRTVSALRFGPQALGEGAGPGRWVGWGLRQAWAAGRRGASEPPVPARMMHGRVWGQVGGSFSCFKARASMELCPEMRSLCDPFVALASDPGGK